jgi:hypothetical protein
MGSEKPYILSWRELAEQALEWDDSSQWGEYDFEKLSELIFEKTSVRLSVSTLKRIWGKVQYNSSPTTITLNALAGFLDFDDWRAFKKQIDQHKIAAPHPQPAGAVSRKKYFQPLVFTLIPLTLIVCLFISFGTGHRPSKAKGNIETKFSPRVISDKMPNSVVFDYDASGYKSNNVFIQQSWDPRRREKVSGQGKQYTSIYYTPGYFNAKLVVNGQIKNEKGVFIKTKGWLGLIDKEPVPIYLDDKFIHLPGGLGIKGETFASLKGSPVFNNSPVFFYNVRPFEGVSGNDFMLETTLRNTSTPGQSVCRKAIVSVMGTKSIIEIPLSDKGCIAAIGLFAGNRMINGKENDLSAFGCDFSDFRHLAFSVENKVLTVSLDGKLIFTTPMNFNIGNIVGIRIGFEGPGEVKDVKLGNSQRVVYRQDFSRGGREGS